jgi:phospholipid/cholesterol/gamma-HCH transport system ATP-binding protein
VIQIIDLKKKFGNNWVTKGVSLTIPDKQMTCIIGRSGEGKSVLLKQIIGLIPPTSGKILVDGVDITKLNDSQLAHQFHKFGYVFQFAALLDSLNVFENIGITLLENGISPEQVEKVVREKLQLVNLNHDVMHKYPSELSGGMRKRVGLARTLVTNPKIILYDEPTTGLDPITSRVIHELMYSMQVQLGLTSVVISHDVEIFKYADNVALLHEGTIKYFGSARTIWESDNPYIYQFIRGLPEGPIKNEITHETNKF